MRRRLLTLLIGLYPPAWRRRYGAELGELASQLARSGARSRVALALGLIVGAVREWWRGHPVPIAALASAGVLAVLALGVSVADSSSTHRAVVVTRVAVAVVPATAPTRTATRPRRDAEVLPATTPRGGLRAVPIAPCPLNDDPQGSYDPRASSGGRCSGAVCAEPVTAVRPARSRRCPTRDEVRRGRATLIAVGS